MNLKKDKTIYEVFVCENILPNNKQAVFAWWVYWIIVFVGIPLLVFQPFAIIFVLYVVYMYGNLVLMYKRWVDIMIEHSVWFFAGLPVLLFLLCFLSLPAVLEMQASGFNVLKDWNLWDYFVLLRQTLSVVFLLYYGLTLCHLFLKRINIYMFLLDAIVLTIGFAVGIIFMSLLFGIIYCLFAPAASSAIICKINNSSSNFSGSAENLGLSLIIPVETGDQTFLEAQKEHKTAAATPKIYFKALSSWLQSMFFCM